MHLLFSEIKYINFIVFVQNVINDFKYFVQYFCFKKIPRRSFKEGKTNIQSITVQKISTTKIHKTDQCWAHIPKS